MCISSTLKRFIPCRTCPSRAPENQGLPEGYYYDTLEGYRVVRECKCHKNYREAQELNRKLEHANLRNDYSFEDYKGTKSIEDLKALKLIAKDPQRFLYKKNIYLYGVNGVQKTSMAVALGAELIKQGYDVFFTTMNTLISNLVKDFNDANQENKDYFIDKCNKCDFLILDECFDKSKVTIFSSGYQVPFLDTFLRNRYEMNKRSTLFISNKLPTEIETQGFSKSLQSLIERTTQQSLLIFEDVYAETANVIDRRGLFADRG